MDRLLDRLEQSFGSGLVGWGAVGVLEVPGLSDDGGWFWSDPPSGDAGFPRMHLCCSACRKVFFVLRHDQQFQD